MASRDRCGQPSSATVASGCDIATSHTEGEAPDAMPRDGTIQRDANTTTGADAWKVPWHPGEGYRHLAAFVAPEALRATELDWGDAEEWRRRTPAGDIRMAHDAIVTALYRALAAAKVRFDREPWNPAGGQRIRWPRWMLARSGTCLDFALTFAAMCLRSHLAPLLVLLEGHGRAENHALVAVDRSRVLDVTVDPVGLPGDRTRDPGVHATSNPGDRLVQLLSGERFVRIDAVAASRLIGGVADEARRRGDRMIADGGWSRLWVVDVAHLHSSGTVAPLGSPPPEASIQRYLPVMPEPRDFPSRRCLVEQLDAARGRLVLVGPPGVGKSLLAHHRAGRADYGCGWFLNASTPDAFLDQLGAAELAERGHDRAEVERPDRLFFAAAALQRLAAADDPWVVVADNADGAPGPLLPHLPDPTRADQVVVVTTTNPLWREVQGFTAVDVPRLDSDEVVALTGGGGELVRLCAGLPLLASAFQQLQTALGWDTDRVENLLAAIGCDGMTGPEAFTSLVLQEAGLDGAAQEVAARCAWLPPDHVPLALLDRLVDDGADAARRLAGLGLLALSTGDATASIHRLFTAALRTRQDDDTSRELALELCNSPAVLAHLRSAADADGVTRLHDVICARLDHQGPTERRVGTALYGLAVEQEQLGQIEESARTFARAESHFDASAAADAGYLAGCLHGQARFVNQHTRREPAREPEFRRALEMSQRAQQLHRTVPDPVGEQRSRALQGLLIHKLALLEPQDTTRERMLREAQAMIDDSYQQRAALLDADHPELARGYFNLAGVRVDLHKLADVAEAESLLAQAGDVYRHVLDTRRRIYGDIIHTHIAACLHGLAIVGYYRALLPGGALTMAERVALLAEASRRGHEALEQRQALDGSTGRHDVRKSARMLAKVALARMALAAREVEHDPSLDELGELADTARDEISASGLFTVPADPSSTGPAGAA